MVCNHCAAFSVCCYVIIIELARYKEKKLTWLPCGGRFFFFERLDRNGSISFKFMVCNHFAAFSVCCYVTITGLGRYN